MECIAFVDDDPNILDGLRRSFRSGSADLDCHFYASGPELLQDLENLDFQIVFSDMQMPEMNGAEVLLAVKERSPDCVRIIISGWAQDELVVECLQSAHQFIAKPTDIYSIKACIQRIVSARSFLQDEDLRAALCTIGSLPTLPQVYENIIREISSGYSSLQSIGKIVAQDIALSANMLKLVNSAFFGPVAHIESVPQAVSILGIGNIENLSLSSSVFTAIECTAEAQLRVTSLNKSGLGVSLLVPKLASCCDIADVKLQDHAQMAGMLLGVGQLIELLVCEETDNLERSQCTHEQLGSYLLSIWGLPLPLVEAVRWHMHPRESGINEMAPLAIVHAAWAMYSMYTSDGEIDLDADVIDRDYLSRVVGEDTLLTWKAVAEAALLDNG